MGYRSCIGVCIIFLALLLPNLTVCNESENEKLSKAANCFTLNFYKQLGKSENGSFVSSPFSLDVLLSILRAGSGGNTQKQLTDSLEYDNLSVGDMENAFKSKWSQLTSSNGNTLQLANSVWIQEGFSVKQSFKDLVTEDFQAQVKNLNFSSDPSGARNEINSWGSDKSHGLIPSLFDKPLDPTTIMVLVNAIYFKGDWSRNFDRDETQDGNFYNRDSKNNPSTVKLMHQQDYFNYKLDSTLKAQVLEMDYKGGDMSMVILLPQEGSNIASLEATLTCENFQVALPSRDEKLVDVTLPKYEITSSFDLKQPIIDAGMNDMFQDTADFTGIASGIRVSQAIQKAVVKVYEEGSEASAVSGVGMMAGAYLNEPPPQIEYFRADRPFLFMIRNKPANLILFIGKVDDLPNA